MNYDKFLQKKQHSIINSGFNPDKINEKLFDFQKAIVKWACEKGKAAVFADCGMGKTAIQLEWSNQVREKTNKPVLIVAPLAVSTQTKNEGIKFSIKTKVIKDNSEIENTINIINYEKLHKIDQSKFSGIVLDESSILKSFSGKIRNQIINDFKDTEYKLACTATPSPNDFTEIGNHAEFLNVCTMQEMLSMYFINDVSNGNGWRLKGHAEEKFWNFIGSWAVMIKSPKDLGFDNKGYILPELLIKNHILDAKRQSETNLFHLPAQTLTERREARKESLEDRVKKTKELVLSKPNEQFIIWCDFNSESEMLAKEINGSVEVRGSDTPEHKEKSMIDFANGDLKILISKSSICGFGMNFQKCHNIIFCGLSDSYEQFYQATRRCWRFGQKENVNVNIVISEKEISVLENIKRKESDFDKMSSNVVNNVSNVFNKINNFKMEYKTKIVEHEDYKIMLGDCVEMIQSLKDESIDYSIFSPPFSSLYTYSNSERDMGNCKDDTEFYEHFLFLSKELFRVVKSGRLLSFHCMNLPTSKFKDGVIGIKDFRGDLIRIFQEAGFIFHSEVCIWKDPVVAMQRTKALGLLHKQIKKDSSMSRQGIPDYLVTMRKPGENKEPITHTNDDFPVDEWQKIASPVWTDIKQSNTLQKQSAREDKDEKHICPLQLDVIERALYLWTNPNDNVLSPFMGIGSEGYVSIKLGRKFIGFELKESYFNQAALNLEAATKIKKQPKLI